MPYFPSCLFRVLLPNCGEEWTLGRGSETHIWVQALTPSLVNSDLRHRTQSPGGGVAGLPAGFKETAHVCAA